MDSHVNQGNEFLTTDIVFDNIYPHSIQLLARQHWTPLRVARLATDFLTAGPPSRILDIGSGAGKFCLAAACFAPQYYFYGIEQRGHILEEAKNAQEKIGVTNVSFLHGNFTQLDLSQFDHFYFFNSFYENLNDEGRIDNDIDYSEDLYRYYVRYLHNGLRLMPEGTRIATYHSLYEEVPLSYDLVDSLEGGNLNFWIKRGS
ncbi:class I SAM-dependent methyltransferase [Pedobacter panaciterrae]|uniref:class I SAM-dependent methyltransferase n=1 Tax=Pedobacter panaciterrae TaxID=363849 RepID=UPI002591FFE8|nr:class I SAM-dependent methyltransferase [uncultured Pedobacter sp.]